jgi:hypothetical protein
MTFEPRHIGEGEWRSLTFWILKDKSVHTAFICR